MTEDQYIDLIPKYLSGNASDAETRQLEEWVLSSDENRELFKAFKKAWMLAGLKREEAGADVEREWKKVSAQLFAPAKTIPLPRRGFLLRIAAAAAVVLLASVWLYRIFDKSDALELATLGAVEDSRLPDGSQVAMNQFSNIAYAPGKDNKRRVALVGDAFFEVERDEERPFVVSAHEVEIEVLGTAFYVDAREDQPQVQVIVQSGTVAVTAGAQRVVLTANEIGIYDKASRSLNKQANEDLNYMAWKTDVLTFENATLEKVVFDLNRRFHARVSLADPALGACEITATFEGKSLDAIVRIVEKTLGLRAEKRGEGVVFLGKCD
jgi:transmembrane sensor